MTLNLITPPATEPVTLAELQTFGRIPAGTEDALVTTLIAAARQHIESPQTGRALITQTWDWFFDAFPVAVLGKVFTSLIIPRPPLQSITYIKYYDINGVLQTLDASRYLVTDTNADRRHGRVTMVFGDYWPVARFQPNAIVVRFVAGWANAAAVPEPLRNAVKMQALTLYEQREQFLVDETIQEVPVVQRLIADYRTYGLTE